MEPCSERLSGNKPCTDRILDYGKEVFNSVYLGVKEPSDFVECKGVRKLKDAGIQVVHVQGLEEECLEVARKGH
ncbi:hypothetical protein SAICODRAFT_30508 [Saitoella complicata NRRL Y-17804]|nr:uncharacterized protein SAICODRAFT_30508 [Saitoella complicata NRRL Y-17804]ODQ52672.1 hypothetical protein SAICODRAFT_30508 [Saitoella complicata NRRL Y-17804]